MLQSAELKAERHRAKSTELFLFCFVLKNDECHTPPIPRLSTHFCDHVRLHNAQYRGIIYLRRNERDAVPMSRSTLPRC